MITNFFIKHGINYVKYPEYKKLIVDDRTRRKFDWVVYHQDEEYYIEFFGLYTSGYKSGWVSLYNNRVEQKIKDITKSGSFKKCIFLYKEDIHNLNNIFKCFLK